MAKKSKIIEHPNTRLANLVEKQQKEIQALRLDVAVLRDLLTRTVRLMAKYENEGLLGKLPKLPETSDPKSKK